MSDAVKRKRPYDSQRRRAQAEETRRDILEAAERQFERRGYAGTAMAEIAADAGVALKTVYLAFGTKSGVLRSLWNMRLRGDQDDRSVADRDWYLEVLEEPDAVRQLRLNARNSKTVKLRISALLEVIRNAAAIDADAAGLWERIQSDFHANQRAIVEKVFEHGRLRADLDVERASDILWTLNHPNTWQLLVVDRQWTPDRYEQWLADTSCAQLLEPKQRRRRRQARV
jgi:AcrR family transcriptional regulator